MDEAFIQNMRTILAALRDEGFVPAPLVVGHFGADPATLWGLPERVRAFITSEAPIKTRAVWAGSEDDDDGTV